MSVDLTAQIHQYLTSAPSSLFAQQAVAVLDHWQGDANLLWRVQAGGEEAVVKMFLDAGQARSRRQFSGHQLFAPLGLAPVPLWADRYPHGLSRQLIVYRWVEGERVDTADETTLCGWAEAVGQLHAAPAVEVNRFSPHPINLAYYWRVEEASIAQVEGWLAESGLTLFWHFHRLAQATMRVVETNLGLWHAAPPTPIHGDLAREHTILTRGQIILLDWEMFGLGDPALDTARLLQREAATLDSTQIERWLDAYLASIDQPNLDARINVYQRLLDVHNVVYLLVGLQQHLVSTSANPADDGTDEVESALPYLQATLISALEGATRALELDSPHAMSELAADFFAWLAHTRAATPSPLRRNL
jgi:aminoglycoside phosphotransferase (APT) family kinase protein